MILSTHNLQGAVATTLTQPLDVLKTRAMNAKPGEFSVCTVYFLVITHFCFNQIHFLFSSLGYARSG